ncbi:hypothetical protein [Clostridium sp.]|uniref:hypothetical protein n=1 Tax=Clostridium sp. TaxID=1506 RepID=UPI00260535BC|nr:hypothetical protein [Clostridium sp.]
MKKETEIKKEKVNGWLEILTQFATIGTGNGQKGRVRFILNEIYEAGIEDGRKQIKEEIINKLQMENI